MPPLQDTGDMVNDKIFVERELLRPYDLVLADRLFVESCVFGGSV